MNQYPIIVDHFTESDCYRASKQTARTGIQVHSVGCKGTQMARWKKSWNRAGRDVCANYIIDTNGIYEVLPEGKRCWLSGSGSNGNANNTHLGFEICEPLTKADTPGVAVDLYGKALYLCTYLCRKYGINPANVQAHYELHALGLASNHADVRHWWGKKGTAWKPYTMDTLRYDIAKSLGVELVHTETIRKGSTGDAVTALQTALEKLAYTVVVDGIFGSQTDTALRQYQAKNGLEVDGVCGAITWATLLAGTDNTSTDTTTDTEDAQARYTVTVPGVDAVTATTLLETYTGATATQTSN